MSGYSRARDPPFFVPIVTDTEKVYGRPNYVRSTPDYQTDFSAINPPFEKDSSISAPLWKKLVSPQRVLPVGRYGSPSTFENGTSGNNLLPNYGPLNAQSYKMNNGPFPHAPMEVGGRGLDLRCNFDLQCPQGTQCLSGKCVREYCTSDVESSSGVCLNTPEYAPPYVSAVQTCMTDGDCGSQNCLNSNKYAPSEKTGTYFCGRPIPTNQYALAAKINPSYSRSWGWVDGEYPLYLQNRPS